MIYAQIEDKIEIQRIECEIQKAWKKSWYRRLMIIKLSGTDKLSVPKLSEMFNLCQATVRSYIHTYNNNGLSALVPKSPTGRRGKITHFTKEDFSALFEQTPNQYEHLNTQSREWTLELIQLYFEAYHQIQVTLPAIYTALRRTGHRTGRSKLRVGSRDPDYQVKRQVIEEMTNLQQRGN